MGENLPRILPKVANSTSLLGSFTCRKFTTWDRRLYFPSEGRRAEDFFARKIRRLKNFYYISENITQVCNRFLTLASVLWNPILYEINVHYM